MASGDLRSVHLVLRSGGSINTQHPKDGSTALMTAALHGHIDIVEYLLGKEDIDIKKRNKVGQSPLHMCGLAKTNKGRTNAPRIIGMLWDKWKDSAILEDKEMNNNTKIRSGKEELNSGKKKKNGKQKKASRNRGPEMGSIDENDNNGRTALHFSG